MRDPKTVYYYVIDNNGGKEFDDPKLAIAEFDLPNTTPEKIAVMATVIKKKVQAITEILTA